MLIVRPDALRRSSAALRGAADDLATGGVPRAPATGASQCVTEEGFLALAAATATLVSQIGDLAAGLTDAAGDGEDVDREVQRRFDQLMPTWVP